MCQNLALEHLSTAQSSARLYPPENKDLPPLTIENGIELPSDSVLRRAEDYQCIGGAKSAPLDALVREGQRNADADDLRVLILGKKLPNGDLLLEENGKTILRTSNGDRITVNPDGSYSINGDLRKASTDKDGTTTVEFADGTKVTFDKDGPLSVQRGNDTLLFGRKAKFEWFEISPEVPIKLPPDINFPDLLFPV